MVLIGADWWWWSWGFCCFLVLDVGGGGGGSGDAAVAVFGCGIVGVVVYSEVIASASSLVCDHHTGYV